MQLFWPIVGDWNTLHYTDWNNVRAVSTDTLPEHPESLCLDQRKGLRGPILSLKLSVICTLALLRLKHVINACSSSADIMHLGCILVPM